VSFIKNEKNVLKLQAYVGIMALTIQQLREEQEAMKQDSGKRGIMPNMSDDKAKEFMLLPFKIAGLTTVCLVIMKIMGW
jgi:hypothetical protein